MINKTIIINSNTKYRNTEGGFIALISTLILTTVLMMVIFTTSTSSFFARFNALGNEFKRISLGLSESCSNAALLKITQNYNYDVRADSKYDNNLGGVVVNVGPDICLIKSITYKEVDSSTPMTIKKLATIQTNAEYPLQNGSWSTNKIVAVINNPGYSVEVAPTCAFVASSTSITNGQSVKFSWSTAGNATSLSVVRGIGNTNTTIYSGSVLGASVTDSPSASATYTATITGPGGSSQCVSPQSIIVQPLNTCADTMIILDRRKGPPTYTNLTEENNAAKALLDLYSGVNPNPKVGVGSFGGLIPLTSPASVPDAPISGHLTNIYGANGTPSTGLYNTINALTANVSIQGVAKLTAGINVGNTELLSDTSTIKKVLILISDGDPGDTKSNVLNAADTAKISNTEIFTISVGTSQASLNSRSLMAAVATGTFIPDPSIFGAGHQNGSFYDPLLTPAEENTDGDHFFITPSAAELSTVFQTIGSTVCPATIPPPPPTAPTAPLPPPAPSYISIDSWDEVINILP